MKKRAQNPDPVRPVQAVRSVSDLRRVRGGATAIEYGLLQAPVDPTAPTGA